MEIWKTIAGFLSLPKDEEQVKKEKVWKIEEGSDFPEPRKKSNGRHCLSNDDFDAGKLPKPTLTLPSP